MLSVRNLVVGRGGKKLLGPLTFNVEPGSVLWIKGSNGIGKTTLLKTLATLLSPLQGVLFWNKLKLLPQDMDYLLETIYLGHTLGLHDLLTPLEYLTLSVVQARGPCFEKNWVPYRTDFQDALAQAGLSHLQHKPCGALSRGQQQRLALSRCLVQPGCFWIMDEPLSGLDTVGQQWVETLIADHTAQGGLVVMVSHSPLRVSHVSHQTLAL